MGSFSWSREAFALRWNCFFLASSVLMFEEYFALYLKQLGFTAQQIGFTTLWGLPALFLPLFGVLADRYRARKLVLVVCTVGLILLSLAPLALLPKIIHQSCNTRQTGHLNNGSRDLSNTSLLVVNSSDLPSKKTPILIFSPSAEHLILSVSDNQSSLLNRTWNLFKATYVSGSSFIFLLIVLIRVLHTVLNISAFLLFTVAVMTYIKKEKADYGSYYCWGQIGAGISLFCVGMFASYLKNTVCGRVVYGYYAAFPFVAITLSLSLVATPWMSYEYLERRVINWAEVKRVVFSRHYIFMLFITFYCGWCYSFLYYWENWYIAEHYGSPTVMAVGGLIRRPVAVLWLILSGKLINRVGELQTVAIALFIFAVSEFSLSVVHLSWLVVVTDIFQSAALGFSYSAITVHFSKPGSKASSAVVLGLADLAYTFGEGSGGTAMGLFFSLTGPKRTMFYYSIATTFILVIFIAYLIAGKNLDEYEKVRDTDSESE